ncbi:hypothetical protein RDI86_01280 [Cellulosimicrobium sp. XJ-DQ-B-000]|uniref:hypothetical protein n=1 Tax=Cellulosimicrobium sp. XJ-DQ-B-000 TaxID=3072182 RepID=UPI0028072634|nr:hypothetical protein [Cellulosimicrobium sp. XJ-DQ-B-000]MDQ8040480.1 hypothetical protein [Cellulosimicrobium sp. XJ-DQ-B-000]
MTVLRVRLDLSSDRYGEHSFEREMPAAPRAGDCVDIDSKRFTVAGVMWTPDSPDVDVVVSMR